MSTRRARAAASENFYVSLNDVLVGILFLFIMLLMTYALNFKKRAEKVDQVFVQRVQKREDLLKKIETRMNAKGPHNPLASKRATMIPQQGILRFPEQLLFAKDQSVLNQSGRDALYDLSTILADELRCYDPKRKCDGKAAEAKGILEAVYVEGHTDEDKKDGRIPGTDGNWDLSSDRAMAAYRALVEVKPSPLENLKNAGGSENLVGISGYAATRHLPGKTKAENRRVDFRFILSAPTEAEAKAAFAKGR